MSSICQQIEEISITMHLKINKNSLVVFLLIFAVIRMMLLPGNYSYLIQYSCIFLCLIFLLSKIKKNKTNVQIWIFLYAFWCMLSSYLNYGLGYRFNYSIVYSLIVILIFNIIPIVVENLGFRKFINITFYALSFLVIISSITVLFQDRIDAGQTNPFFVGNKFNVAYLQIIYCCICGLKFLKTKNGFSFKIYYWIVYFYSIWQCWYTYSTTGLFILILNGIYILYINWKATIKSNVFPKLKLIRTMRKPIVLLLCIVFSGLTVLIFGSILNIPFVSTFIDKIEETGTLNARMRIYSVVITNLFGNHLLIGNGHNSNIVGSWYMDAYGSIAPNAQNGLINIFVQYGLIGTVLFLIMVFYSYKNVSKVYSKKSDWLMYWIYAFAFAGIVEICYGTHLFLLLVIRLAYNYCGENLNE